MSPMVKGVAAKERVAYVTFLAGSGDYWKGVVCLAKGLRAVKSSYPLVVAVLPDVPGAHRRALLDQGCLVREIQPVLPPDSQTKFAMPHYIINYSKLRIWEFVDYERLVFLDADIQVYANIDHLFDLEAGQLYAVKDCFCEAAWGEQCQEMAAWFPKPPPQYFNGGMLVLEPSLATAKALLDRLALTTGFTPFAEQDFLNMFFKDVYKPIPWVYNLLVSMLWRHPEKVQLGKAKVVHYCALGSKPWRFTGEEPHMDRQDMKMLVNRWWDIYNDESLNYKHAADPLRVALTEAGAVKHFSTPSAA
ncbi:galactinol synthase 1-like isoform X1 [Lolium rigidum]|uniref:galactinol synthase 1-like isoform X1 n=1 Tax=Lolium rigidum TaxID=89674 RepID=UPI001F5C49A4|nr:galactinol synthase 1-like isoform X1 [Lolium rigidum]